MTEKTAQMRVYLRDLDRVKNFGRAGDSMAEALSRALDLAESRLAEDKKKNNA
jgi:C4-dicarboxylate-specific signal transduction histidine kinase